MRNAHGGLGAVYVLAARTARAVHVDPKVGRIHLDIDVVVHLGRHEHRRERGVPAITRVEGRLAHQSVHAGLGAQPAIGVLANDVHGRTFYTRDFASGSLDDFSLEFVRLGPAQIHPEEHFRPVLRLGAAGAGLDVEVRVVGIHFAGEHAPEFEALDARLEAPQVALHFGCGRRVVFLDGKRQQLVCIAETVRDLVEPDDDLLQPRPLLAESLRALGIVPDVRLFKFAPNLGQPFRLLIVVKDTSSTRPRVQ